MEHLDLNKQHYKFLGDLLQVNGYLKFSFALSKESQNKILDSNSSLEQSKSLIEELNKYIIL